MKKENFGDAVQHSENDNRIMIDLDKLIAVIQYDESVFEQLNNPKRT